MPPLTLPFASVKLENGRADNSPLELALITVAIACSVTLSVLPTSHLVARPMTSRLSSQIIQLFAAASGLAALGLCAAAVILGWRCIISFDALAGVVISLIPALVSLPPRIIFTSWYYARRMRARRSLNVRLRDFRYIRFARRCGDDIAPSRDPARTPGFWADNFGGQCNGADCRVTMFIRIMPAPGADPFLRAFENEDSATRTAAGQGQVVQRYGMRIGHTRNFVLLRDLDHRMTAWWWASLQTGTRLMADPSLVRLNSMERVLNGLALLADIISISSLLQRYDRFLADQVKSNRALRSAITGIEGIVCNLILDELKLDNWGRIGPEMIMEDYVYRRLHRKKVLFLFLTHTSNVFRASVSETVGGLDGARLSAQQILDRIMESGTMSKQAFGNLCKELVEAWLRDWGCPKQQLVDFNHMIKPLGTAKPMPHARHSWEQTATAAAMDRIRERAS